MIAYSDTSAFPDFDDAIVKSNYGGDANNNNNNNNEDNKKNKSTGVIMSVDDATKNCNNLHVVLTNQDRNKQCIALVGQYESFHVQKFMRASPEPDPAAGHTYSVNKFKIDPSYPLRLVNRGMKTDGGKSIHTPTIKHAQTNWKNLVPYLQSLDDVLTKLKPIAESVAKNNDHNTVIVLVCNFGQSELLMNCKFLFIVVMLWLILFY